eukprot:3491305-Rhodomonas_salina.1
MLKAAWPSSGCGARASGGKVSPVPQKRKTRGKKECVRGEKKKKKTIGREREWPAAARARMPTPDADSA